MDKDEIFDEIESIIIGFKINMFTEESSIKKLRKLWGELGHSVDDENARMFLHISADQL